MVTLQPAVTSHRLTGVQWLICAIAALGFAFDTYALLVLPLIVRPAFVIERVRQLGRRVDRESADCGEFGAGRGHNRNHRQTQKPDHERGEREPIE